MKNNKENNTNTPLSNEEEKTTQVENNTLEQENLPKEEPQKPNKKAKKEKKQKVFNPEKNANALKKGSFSIVFIAVFLVVLVLANMLSVLIANKYSTTIDVTTDRSSKLTSENIEYLKNLNAQTDIKKIEIIVCASKQSYIGTEMLNYVLNNYYVQESNTPYSYFNQTIRLIEEYPKYNNKITISYHDTQEPEFAAIASQISTDVSFGDILVRCTKEDNSVKTDLITFSDIYSLQSASGSYSQYYTIGYSNLENALSGSLNKVAMNITKKAGIITQNCDINSITHLQNYLTNYDYTYTNIEGNFTLDTLKEYDVLIISKLKNDFTSDSLKILDAYLENDGNLGKSVVYFASQSSPDTPNFNMFLEDWGIGVDSGVVYETNSSNIYNNYVTFGQTLYGSTITASLASSTKFYISGGNVPLKATYTTNNTRTTNILLESPSSCLIAPKGTTTKTTFPEGTEQKSFPTVILTKDSRTDSESNEISSSVLAFASSDFINEEWSSFSAVGNMELAMLAVNSASGRNTSLTFNPKITGITGITDPASDAVKNIVNILFIIVLPLISIAGGVVVWIIRKRR